MATRSPVWNYFDVDPVCENKAVCKVCKNYVSRGGTNRR